MECREVIVILITVVAFMGCMRKDSNSKVSYISVRSSQRPVSLSTDVVEDIDTIRLSTDKGDVLGEIQDICVSDSFIYILDQDNKISAFNKRDGDLVKQIRAVGQGPEEYVSPIAMTSDENSLYVLDLTGMGLVIYDDSLNFKKKVGMSFPAFDLVKLSNGFLFYNLVATDSLGHFVYTDDEGVVINSFINTNTNCDLVYNKRVFSRDSEGNIYMSEPLSDKIYTWGDNEVSLLYEILLDDKDLKIAGNYVTSDYIISGFMNGETRCYNIFNRQDSTSMICDIGKASRESPYVFGQYRGGLICVDNSYELLGDMSGEGYSTMVLIYYLKKD